MARTVLNQVVADFNDDTDDSPLHRQPLSLHRRQWQRPPLSRNLPR